MSNKRAIFWVANRLNLDIGYQPNKVKQFCRFHTSTTILGLCKQIIFSFLKPHFLEEINQIKFKRETKNSSIVFNPNILKIRNKEIIIINSARYLKNLIIFI